MNRHYLYLPAVALVLSACGGGGPITPGTFDPLNAAGSVGNSAPTVDTGFKPGTFVKTSTANAAFFKNKPDGNASADKTLKANTPAKVISTAGSFVKIELDSGEVGYVSALQLIDQDGDLSQPEVYDGNAVQVYPLVGSGYPDTTSPTPSDLPGSQTIPEVIDPDAPVPEIPDIPPLPDDAPTPGLGAEPALPDATPEPKLPDAEEKVEEVKEKVEEAAADE